MATPNTIKSIIASMAANYPNPPKDEHEFALIVETWTQVLSDVPDEILKAAAADYLRSDAIWRPAPGQLRALALRGLNQDAQAQAETAWEKIRGSDFGRRTIDDPLAIRTMQRIGGFAVMGQDEEKNEHWWHKRFVEMYAESAERRSSEVYRINDGMKKELVSG